MYKVEFVKSDDKTITFDNVEKIQFGKNHERLITLNEHQILNEFFPRDGYFHFVCKSSNVSYHDNDTVYVVIKKLDT